jgi:hypothetical protein
MNLADHLKLLERASTSLNINLDVVVAKEYAQEGYKQHINDNHITILSGFNESQGFPPTNMILKLFCKR